MTSLVDRFRRKYGEFLHGNRGRRRMSLIKRRKHVFLIRIGLRLRRRRRRR